MVWLVVLVDRVVDVVLEVVCPLSSKSFSSDSDSDPWSSADCPSRSPVVVVCVEVVWDSVVLVAGWLSVEPVVTCARPTPAAAANASPTSAPTRERRVMRVSLLRTWNPFGAWRAGAYVWSVAIDGRNLRRAPSDGGLRRGQRPAGPVAGLLSAEPEADGRDVLQELSSLPLVLHQSQASAIDHRHAHDDLGRDEIHDHGHGEHGHARSTAHDSQHGHSHGLVDPSILRSRAGVKAVSLSLAVLTVTAFAQAFIYYRTLSVALLADLIHNFGDALTAVPLGIAFYLRSARGERLGGLGVVLAIFISALVALGQTIERFIHPRTLSHLWLLAFAGVIGFIGNEIAAQIRLRAGARLGSAALVADGRHARVDGFVSLGVIASAAVVALGFEIADPIIGLIITLVILRITWQSWQTIRGAQIEIDHFEHHHR